MNDRLKQFLEQVADDTTLADEPGEDLAGCTECTLESAYDLGVHDGEVFLARRILGRLAEQYTDAVTLLQK